MKTTILLALLIGIGQLASAQNAHFITQGVIAYEKKVNVYGIFQDQIKKNPDNNWTLLRFEDYKKNNPQFTTKKSTLTFAKDNTHFVPQAEEKVQSVFSTFPATQQNNTIFTDTRNGLSVAQKQVYETKFLVKDSVRKVEWKITDERRTIAGFDCRRANAIIMDSVYVVAFYSDEIPVSGGPESFCGLPGMILGVALPREHITWFATSVTEQAVEPDKIQAPIKGKPATNKELYGILKEAMKDWGPSGSDYVRAAFY